MHKLFPICIFLLYFQQIAQCFQVYQLNSKPESDAPSLKEIIQKERNNEIEYVKNNRATSAQKRRGPQPMGKSLLVKRIVPHGYVGSDYEYDAKLNTVFKPLVRFHVKKPIAEHEKAILKDMEAKEERERKREEKNQLLKGKNRFRKGKNRFRKGKIRSQKGKHGFRKRKDGLNDALIVLVKKDSRNPHDLLRQIKNYINRNRRRPQKKNKKRFRSLLGRLKDDSNDNALRSLFEKSGEDRDPLAPGKLPEYLQPDILPEEETEPKPVFESYPFWNYWTYKKNIIQDACKGNLVQVGNMCVNPVGHRKYLEPIKNSIKHRNPRRKSVKSVNPWKLLKSLRPQKLVSLRKKPPKKKKGIPTSPRKYRKFQYKK